jgi:hypothetical protein
MGVRVNDTFLIRKIVALKSFGYTGLQGALDGVASQIVCTAVFMSIMQDARLAEARVGKRLQVFPVHGKILFEQGVGK